MFRQNFLRTVGELDEFQIKLCNITLKLVCAEINRSARMKNRLARAKIILRG